LLCREEKNVVEKRDTGKKACLVVLMLLFFLASSIIPYPRNAAASNESGGVRGDSRVSAERVETLVISGEYEN
jgi:hypothetical protein